MGINTQPLVTALAHVRAQVTDVLWEPWVEQGMDKEVWGQRAHVCLQCMRGYEACACPGVTHTWGPVTATERSITRIVRVRFYDLLRDYSDVVDYLQGLLIDALEDDGVDILSTYAAILEFSFEPVGFDAGEMLIRIDAVIEIDTPAA